jgi:hypothetical protein
MMPLGQHFGCLDGIFAGEDPAFELAADVTAGDAKPRPQVGADSAADLVLAQWLNNRRLSTR